MSVAKFASLCATALGVILGVSTAQAADLYGYPGYKDGPLPVTWQGFYIGGFAGWGWAGVNGADNVVLLGGPGIVPIGGITASGVMGGAQLGYNVQASNFVYSIEIDLGGLDAGAGGTFTDPGNVHRVISVTSRAGFYGDVTGRAGLIVGNTLLYAKGGFAFFSGGVTVNDAYDGIHQDSGTFTGWTIGGGAEYMLAPNWTVKLEYQYIDLDNNNFTCCLGSATRLDNTITANTVKAGFNYQFHSLYLPLN